jgi:DNA-binding XRE family transcriptional regulator
MAKKRVVQDSSRSAARIEREREIRERFQRDRPSLESLTASGEFTPPMKQGEYLTLMEFAARMKEVREQKHLSLTDVAIRSGIDKSAISRLENGLTENPTIGTLSKVARSLGKRIRIELDDVEASGARGQGTGTKR